MSRVRFLLGSTAAIALAVACGEQGDAASPGSRNVVPDDPSFHPVVEAGVADAARDAGEDASDASDAGDAADARDD